MPEVNNVALSNNELEELRLLVKKKREGAILSAFAMKRLDPQGIGDFPDQGLVRTYKSLEEKGLIEGRPRDGAFRFIGLNQSGIDWVDDYERRSEVNAKGERLKRRHDYIVASFGAIIGCMLTLLLEHFTEILALLSVQIQSQ